MLINVSTPGPDRYADGSVVRDGECYALVWSPKGTPFSGFNADGTPTSPSDRVVLAAPLAMGGKCRDAIFQIPHSEYEELKDGEWTVCLVDTRNADGVPAGVQGNAPLRVNRWGAVESGVKIRQAGESGAKTSSVSSNTRSQTADEGVSAGNLSTVPDSVKPPRITAFDILESGKVSLEVADTVPFLSYTIVSGSEPVNLQEDPCSNVVDGKDGAKIAISTASSATCRFFKVVRAE